MIRFRLDNFDFELLAIKGTVTFLAFFHGRSEFRPEDHARCRYGLEVEQHGYLPSFEVEITETD